jgi:hypothetical protein
VLSLAHGLIGLPASWHAERSGGLAWHPSGSVFAGAGRSERGIPYAYHADWTSTGRWSVEVHTRTAAYRLCPLEQAFRRTSPTGPWEPLPLTVTAPELKPGFLEQVAGWQAQGEGAVAVSPSLEETAALVKYGEAVFGYDP